MSEMVSQSGKRRRIARSHWTRALVASTKQFMALWQRLRKESCTVHTSEQISEQQADLSDDFVMGIRVLALKLGHFSRPTKIL